METKVYFSQIQEQIIQHINNANSEIVIAVAWFTDKAIIKAILNSLKKNIRVRILFYDDKINKKELYERLFDLGAEIRYTKTMMHNKFCVIDKSIVINGSYNWTQNASLNNKENIQISYGDEKLSYSFILEFERLFDGAIDYKYYIDGYKKMELDIESITHSVLLEYSSLFQHPKRYPCILKIPNLYIEHESDVHDIFFNFEACKKQSVRNGRYSDPDCISMYILLKSEDDLSGFIRTIFKYKANSIVYPDFCLSLSREKQLEIQLKNSKNLRIDDIKLRNFCCPLNEFARSKCIWEVKDPFLIDVFNVDNETSEFTVNDDFTYQYMYPEDDFFIVSRKRIRTKTGYRSSDVYCVLGLVNRYGEVKGEAKIASMHGYYSCKFFVLKGDIWGIRRIVEGRYGVYSRYYFPKNNDTIISVEFPEGWHPIRFVGDYIIVCYCLFPDKSYSIADSSGKLILRSPRYYAMSYVCYREISQNSVEFLYGEKKAEFSNLNNDDLWNMLCDNQSYKHLNFDLRTKNMVGLPEIEKYAEETEEKNRRKVQEEKKLGVIRVNVI